MSIKKYKNYDHKFFRALSITLLAELEGKIHWTNAFTDGEREVIVPWYYSKTGDGQYLLDTFVNDIASSEQLAQEVTKIPRGYVVRNSFRIKSEEFANPNEWVRMTEPATDIKEIQQKIAKIRALPIQVNYHCVMILDSELDVDSAMESIMNLLTFYRFMWFQYNYLPIDAYVRMPDETDIQIVREQAMGDDLTLKVEWDMEVHTYYPAYNPEHALKPIRVNWANLLRGSGPGDIDRGLV